MNFNVDIGQLITDIGKVASTVLPIIALGSLLFKNVRSALIKGIRKIVGLESILDNISEMQEQIKTIEKILNSHIELDQDKYEAQLNILKDSLIKAFYFYMDRGWISLEELSVLQDLYNSYLKFGGNGVIKARWENEIIKLSNRNPDDKE